MLSVVGGAVVQWATDRDNQIFPLHWTYTGQNWQMPERADAHQRAVDLIPEGSCVEAADTAVPHLTGHTYVGLAGTIDDSRVNWLIIDTWAEELGAMTRSVLMKPSRALGAWGSRRSPKTMRASGCFTEIFPMTKPALTS